MASPRLTSDGPSEVPDWLQTARVFLIDAYYPPMAPELEFDAEALAKTMEVMNVNTVRMATMGKYATIQGVRFTRHPDQGDRDLLAEMIATCKLRDIKVVPYISTGHKLAWSMATQDYPEYAQRTRPGGGPQRSHMFVGEDHGTICWMTPYRQAFMDLVEHVVRDYDVAGLLCNMTTKGDRRVVHLTNWTGNKLEHILAKDCYLAPVENVVLRVRLSGQERVKSFETFVRSVPVRASPSERLTASLQTDVDGAVEIRLPRIDAYQAVLMELE